MVIERTHVFVVTGPGRASAALDGLVGAVELGANVAGASVVVGGAGPRPSDRVAIAGNAVPAKAIRDRRTGHSAAEAGIAAAGVIASAARTGASSTDRRENDLDKVGRNTVGLRARVSFRCSDCVRRASSGDLSQFRELADIWRTTVSGQFQEQRVGQQPPRRAIFRFLLGREDSRSEALRHLDEHIRCDVQVAFEVEDGLSHVSFIINRSNVDVKFGTIEVSPNSKVAVLRRRLRFRLRKAQYHKNTVIGNNHLRTQPELAFGDGFNGNSFRMGDAGRRFALSAFQAVIAGRRQRQQRKQKYGKQKAENGSLTADG
jgi:hypothetical protein